MSDRCAAATSTSRNAWHSQDQIELLRKLTVIAKPHVSRAERDYKCSFVWPTTTKGAVLSLGTRNHCIYAVRRLELLYSLIETQYREFQVDTLSSSFNIMAMKTSISTAWKVQAQTGINDLVFEEDTAVSEDIGDHGCLVTIEASSLNYRDIMIANVSFAAHFMPTLAP